MPWNNTGKKGRKNEYSSKCERTGRTDVCEAMRAEGIVEVSEEAALPAVCNDPEVVRGLTESAKRVLGEDSVLTLDFPSMGSDDFSIFLKYARGAQFFLGTGNKNDNSRLGLP